jgi:hypothetical protein
MASFGKRQSWPASARPSTRTNWWNPSKGAVAMQVMWMLVNTLGLAFSGVLGLALVTRATSRTKRR